MALSGQPNPLHEGAVSPAGAQETIMISWIRHVGHSHLFVLLVASRFSFTS